MNKDLEFRLLDFKTYDENNDNGKEVVAVLAVEVCTVSGVNSHKLTLGKFQPAQFPISI